MTDPGTAQLEPRGRRARGVALLVIAATLLGVGLRMYNLTVDNLWADEIASTVLSGAPTVGEVVEQTAIRDSHPPTYYVMLHLWRRAFGSSDGAIRALSVLLGAAAVPAIYLLSRALFGTSIGVTAAFIMAAMPTGVRFSQEARNYVLLTLLMILAWYFAVRISRGRDRTATVGFALCAVALPWAQYWGGPVLASAVLVYIALLWRDERHRGRLWQLVPGVVLSAVLFLPWIAVIMRHQLTTAAGGVFPGTVELVSIMGVFARPFGYMLMMTPVGVLALATVAASVVVLLVVGTDLRRWPAQDYAVRWSVGMLMLPVVLIAIIGSVTTFWVGIRVPNVTMVPVAVISAAAIVSLWRLRPAAGIALGLTVAFLCATGLWRNYTELDRPDWESITATVQQQERPGDVVVTIDDTFIPQAFERYYGGSLPVRGLSRDIAEPDAIVDSAMRLWGESGRMWLIVVNPADSAAPRVLRELASDEEAFRIGSINFYRLGHPSQAPSGATAGEEA